MYLLHQHIGYMLLNRFEGAASSAQLIAATAVALVAASWLIWRYVERPAQKWMKRSLERGLDWLGATIIRRPFARAGSA